MRYIHENGVILRNFDAKSVLLSEDDQSYNSQEDDFQCKSRAIARILRLDKAQIMGYEERTNGLYDDIRYRSPEQIKGTSYDSKADVWAFGVLLFFMLTGVHPFDSKRA